MGEQADESRRGHRWGGPARCTPSALKHFSHSLSHTDATNRCVLLASCFVLRASPLSTDCGYARGSGCASLLQSSGRPLCLCPRPLQRKEVGSCRKRCAIVCVCVLFYLLILQVFVDVAACGPYPWLAIVCPTLQFDSRLPLSLSLSRLTAWCRYYLKSRNAKAAIEMFVAAGKWEEAHKLSNKYMQKEDVADMYLDKVRCPHATLTGLTAEADLWCGARMDPLFLTSSVLRAFGWPRLGSSRRSTSTRRRRSSTLPWTNLTLPSTCTSAFANTTTWYMSQHTQEI